MFLIVVVIAFRFTFRKAKKKVLECVLNSDNFRQNLIHKPPIITRLLHASHNNVGVNPFYQLCVSAELLLLILKWMSYLRMSLLSPPVLHCNVRFAFWRNTTLVIIRTGTWVQMYIQIFCVKLRFVKMHFNLYHSLHAHIKGLKMEVTF